VTGKGFISPTRYGIVGVPDALVIVFVMGLGAAALIQR
jgi:hypothetical protein